MIKLNNSFLSRAVQGHKVDIQKREIVRTVVHRGALSITELSKAVNLSVPTVTKFLGELIKDGFLTDCGHEHHPPARRAVLYGLKSDAGYFVGVDVTRIGLTLCLIDFSGEVLAMEVEPFAVENDLASLDALCGRITHFVERNKLTMQAIMAVGVSLTGRVDSATGYSYSLYSFDDQPLSELMSDRLGVLVHLENDSRAMAYGEYMCREEHADPTAPPSTMIFINLSWGFGIGMVIDGKLFYGRSGFAGEYGHIPMADNQILCQCGKRGCLETAVSGAAARRLILERLEAGGASLLSEVYKKEGDISLQDVIAAVQAEDMLAIEVIEEIGDALGKAVSGIINIFSPDTVVFGGGLVPIKDYLMLPMRSGVNKYSLRFVSRITEICASSLGPHAAVIGASLLVRSKMLGLI